MSGSFANTETGPPEIDNGDAAGPDSRTNRTVLHGRESAPPRFVG